MGKSGVKSSGPVTKELAELSCHIKNESKEIRDGVMGEGQGVSKENEFRVNEDVQDGNDGRPEAVQAEVFTMSGQQRSEQQPQGPLVCWEEFLSVRSLKVLLVENDYSTRQLATALLRNCGYEVIAVANGMKAWKILKNLTNRVDLVLSEVVMPSLSGIDLLTKIMNHKTCKNIPVIMMSSNESMSIVLKCLSKGAVDFLVKPIRKNELKNLWQHVWRKCHNQSSGSASESGVPTQTSTKSTSAEESEKNNGSNYGDNIGSFGLDARDEGDNGSGTEITQVTHSGPEAIDNDGVPPIKTGENVGQHEELDLGIGAPGIPNFQLEDPKEKGLSNMAGTNKNNEQLQKGQPELNNEKPNWELRNQDVDLMGVTTTSSIDPQMQSVMFDIRNGISKIPDIKDKAIHDNKEIPSLELSLKRQRDVRNTGFSDHDRNVLRHSNHSAFSRYKFPKTSNQAPSGNLGSYSPLENSSQEAKEKSLQNIQSNSNSTPLYHQHSNAASSNNDTGSTTNNFFTKEKACEDKPEHNGIISLSQPIIQGKTDAAVSNTTLSQGRGMNQQLQVQHHHQHMHNVPQHQHQQMPNHDHLPLKNLEAAAPKCGSSNVQGAPMEGNVGNHSLHWRGSGSNHSSNTQSGGSSAIISRGTYMESDKGIIGEERTISAVGDGSKSGVDQNHLSQREAALHKFRQKRKERCFEKKVRYQSRKKLAEQRPRVRGQFVRQVVHENKGNDIHC